MVPRSWRDVLVALATLAVTAVVGANATGSAAPGGSGVLVPGETVDVPRGGILVVEESSAPGCQPWRWNRDQTACINATVQLAQRTGARGIGFTRGREYRYGNELWLAPGLVATAVGDPSRPRPVLRGSRTARGVMLRSGGEIRNLDIRGPHYNAAPFRVRLHEDWDFKGINAANQSNWSVVGTSVNGFAGTGLLAVMGDNVRVIDSSFSHNGYSGVSLFPHNGYCGSGALLRGNVMERNGQDGVDTCASNATFEGNVFRNNGWHGNGGDMHGILVWTFAVPTARNIRIIGNRIYGNAESGVRVAGNRITGVVIQNNEIRRNGHYGLQLAGRGGPMTDVDVRNNRVDPNGWGCLSPETGRMVTAGRAGCER